MVLRSGRSCRGRAPPEPVHEQPARGLTPADPTTRTIDAALQVTAAGPAVPLRPRSDPRPVPALPPPSDRQRPSSRLGPCPPDLARGGRRGSRLTDRAGGQGQPQLRPAAHQVDNAVQDPPRPSGVRGLPRAQRRQHHWRHLPQDGTAAAGARRPGHAARGRARGLCRQQGVPHSREVSADTERSGGRAMRSEGSRGDTDLVGVALAVMLLLCGALSVTYGPRASTGEGDPDFRETIYLEVPATIDGSLYLKVFDTDTGGAHDPPYGAGWNTTVRYAVYGGAGPATLPALPVKDTSRGATRAKAAAARVAPGSVTGGAVLADRQTGESGALDDGWETIASFTPDQGERVGDRYVFRLEVTGLAGDDANAFEVTLSLRDRRNVAPPGLEILDMDPVRLTVSDGSGLACGRASDTVQVNRFGSHSPPLAASSARGSEPDVRLTAAPERLTVPSPNTPPLGAGVLYCPAARALAAPAGA